MKINKKSAIPAIALICAVLIVIFCLRGCGNQNSVSKNFKTYSSVFDEAEKGNLDNAIILLAQLFEDDSTNPVLLEMFEKLEYLLSLDPASEEYKNALQDFLQLKNLITKKTLKDRKKILENEENSLKKIEKELLKSLSPDEKKAYKQAMEEQTKAEKDFLKSLSYEDRIAYGRQKIAELKNEGEGFAQMSDEDKKIIFREK